MFGSTEDDYKIYVILSKDYVLVQQCEKETKTKLPLKAQIVKPAQRIPRYELLLRVSALCLSVWLSFGWSV